MRSYKKPRVEDKMCVASYCCSNCSSPRCCLRTSPNVSDTPRTCALLLPGNIQSINVPDFGHTDVWFLSKFWSRDTVPGLKPSPSSKKKKLQLDLCNCIFVTDVSSLVMRSKITKYDIMIIIIIIT